MPGNHSTFRHLFALQDDVFQVDRGDPLTTALDLAEDALA